MTNLTKIIAPFRDLGRDTKIALFAAWLDGKQIQCQYGNGGWLNTVTPTWLPSYRYRVKPATPDRIAWDHVAPKYVCLARDQDGDAILYTAPVEASARQWLFVDVDDFEMAEAADYASYQPGTCDWRDSLLWRPGYGPEGE